MSRKTIPAIAYLRTSSATNAGPDKDSDKRQRVAIAAFAKAHGYKECLTRKPRSDHAQR